MNIEILILIAIGICFVVGPSVITKIFAKFEWVFWKQVYKFNENGDYFKSSFKNKSPKFIRITGIIILAAILFDLLFKRLILN